MNPFTRCLLLLFLPVFSCRNANAVKHKASSDTIAQVQKIFDTTKWEANTIDTFNYSNLPYWNEKMDRFDSAYVDTFSVDGCKFRFVNPKTNLGKEALDASVFLEKNTNNNWVFNGFRFGRGNKVYEFYHSRDVNGDGFVDITQHDDFSQNVTYFDSGIKDYTDTIIDENSQYINPEWAMIDTARKVFCDFQELKQMCGQITSTLYTYDGFKKINLYRLLLDNCNENGSNTSDGTTPTIHQLILYKTLPYKNDDPTRLDNDSLLEIQKIHLPKPIEYEDDYSQTRYFNYVKFWKERYKKLLGY